MPGINGMKGGSLGGCPDGHHSRACAAAAPVAAPAPDITVTTFLAMLATTIVQ